MTKIKDLKVNDVFYMEGLTPSGKVKESLAKLIRYEGMDKYIIETGGITMIAYGDDKVRKTVGINDIQGIYR